LEWLEWAASLLRWPRRVLTAWRSFTRFSSCLKSPAAYDAHPSAWREEKHKTRQPTDAALGSRLAIVFKGSPLFAGGAGSGESDIRTWIIENDWLEAIVALPEQMPGWTEARTKWATKSISTATSIATRRRARWTRLMPT